jgi:hypothetical protein
VTSDRQRLPHRRARRPASRRIRSLASARMTFRVSDARP